MNEFVRAMDRSNDNLISGYLSQFISEKDREAAARRGVEIGKWKMEPFNIEGAFKDVFQ